MVQAGADSDCSSAILSMAMGHKNLNSKLNYMKLKNPVGLQFFPRTFIYFGVYRPTKQLRLLSGEQLLASRKTCYLRFLPRRRLSIRDTALMVLEERRPRHLRPCPSPSRSHSTNSSRCQPCTSRCPTTTTSLPDTSLPDTRPPCSSPLGTSPLDTSPLDTNPLDTSPLDTSPLDTSPLDTSPLDTSLTATSTLGTSLQ